MHTNDHFLLPRCTGMNCGATDANHSPECRAEHAAAVAGGRFVKDDARIAPRADAAPRPFTDEQIAALRVAADTLIERYAEPIRVILRDAEQPRMWIETGGFGSNEPPRLVVDDAPRASYGSGMIDAIEDFAPVPRADADTAGAPSITAEEFERWRIASKEHRDGLLANFPKEKPISDAMMDLVDRLGSEASEVDPRAWKHLLVYAPQRADAEKDAALTDDEICDIWLRTTGFDQRGVDQDVIGFARAILTAKEKKS
jgi:hypothetical protein